MNRVNWKPVRKIIAAALGGATSTGVIAIADWLGLEVNASLAALVAALCATLAGYLMPAVPK